MLIAGAAGHLQSWEMFYSIFQIKPFDLLFELYKKKIELQI